MVRRDDTELGGGRGRARRRRRRRTSGALRKPRSGNRNFRIVYLGTFASNIGTWMQNVVLGAYALKLTGSPTFVGLIFFAQLGPLLFLSTTGGLLADVVDRRRLLVAVQLVQMVLSFGLAALVLIDEPPRGRTRRARVRDRDRERARRARV